MNPERNIKPPRNFRAGESSTIEQAASDWIARRDRGLTPAERTAFADWSRADPRHPLELERLEATWTELDRIKKVDTLQAMAADVVARARAGRARRRFVWFASLAGAAAALLAVAFTTLRDGLLPSLTEVRVPHYPRDNYRVLESTVHRLTLADGSVAELNGASEIAVDFSSTERRVQLLVGEVHFIVAKDGARPFYVTAGPVTVRAVGTAFNVRLAAESVEVLVTEGKVKLHSTVAPSAAEAVELAAEPLAEVAPALVEGQRAVISRTGPVSSGAVAIGDVGQAEIDETLGWQSVRLVFNNTPLHEVVAGFNEYNAHRLTIGDSRIRGRILTGVFRADNLDGFVRLLRASLDVKAEQRTSHETVLLPAR